MTSQDAPTICLSLDMDWAHPEVLEDSFSMIAERGLAATVFVTGPDVAVPKGFERAPHPNYRHSSDLGRSYFQNRPPVSSNHNYEDYYRFVIEHSLGYSPEAKGVRSHSLMFDSMLLKLYRQAGLEYDSTYVLPLAKGIAPVLTGFGILELPIFFNDHFELKNGFIGLNPSNLDLDTPGLKVLQFHPQMIYINAASDQDYQDCRPFYQDPDKLIRRRRRGKGMRDLFASVLDRLADRPRVSTLGEVNKSWREQKGQTTSA